MGKFKLLNAAAILSSVIATPVLAQAVIQEPGAYAFYRPNGDLSIGYTLSGPRETPDVVRGAVGTAVTQASARNSRWYAHASAKRHSRS